MRWMVSGFALALALSASAAFSQTKTPDMSHAPSAQNSGAGIAGQPGNKNGPAAKPETKGTVGSSTNNPQNPAAVQQQDPSKVKGMRGGKSGPPAK